MGQEKTRWRRQLAQSAFATAFLRVQIAHLILFLFFVFFLRRIGGSVQEPLPIDALAWGVGFGTGRTAAAGATAAATTSIGRRNAEMILVDGLLAFPAIHDFGAVGHAPAFTLPTFSFPRLLFFFFLFFFLVIVVLSFTPETTASPAGSGQQQFRRSARAAAGQQGVFRRTEHVGVEGGMPFAHFDGGHRRRAPLPAIEGRV